MAPRTRHRVPSAQGLFNLAISAGLLRRPPPPTTSARDFRATELQDHAIGVLQLNAASAGRDRTARTNHVVSAFN